MITGRSGGLPERLTCAVEVKDTACAKARSWDPAWHVPRRADWSRAERSRGDRRQRLSATLCALPVQCGSLLLFVCFLVRDQRYREVSDLLKQGLGVKLGHPARAPGSHGRL